MSLRLEVGKKLRGGGNYENFMKQTPKFRRISLPAEGALLSLARQWNWTGSSRKREKSTTRLRSTVSLVAEVEAEADVLVAKEFEVAKVAVLAKVAAIGKTRKRRRPNRRL
jgi:hypothetical protein